MRSFIGGNHKMVGNKASLSELVGKLRASLGDGELGLDVVIAPPLVLVEHASRALAGSSVQLAGQNCSDKTSGALTGETAAGMLREAGCGWTLVGHSERRGLFGESDELAAGKAAAAQGAGLGVVGCVGETLAERERGETREVVARQVRALAKGVADWARTVVAYEPVWAIGTGKTASPQQAQEVHQHIRALLAELAGAETAKTVRIIYGGSVTAENCAALAAEPDINGFLVGGASLKADSFVTIVQSKQAKANL